MEDEPAFPQLTYYDNGSVTHYGGMSLRDYFAGQAVVGLIAGAEAEESAAGFAERAYRCADAMLEARKK